MQTQPPKYVSPPGTWKTKLALRAASLVCVVVIAGLGGSLATTSRVHLGLMMAVLVPALIVTFVWDLAECFCILKRGGNRGIHPGAIVAIDLFAWMGWGLLDLFIAALGVASRPHYVIDDYNNYPLNGYDTPEVSDEDAQLERDVMGKGRALVAFTTLTAVLHFVIFVIACYETNKRNRIPRTVYVMQPVYGPPLGTPSAYQQLGSQPMPGQPMPQHYMYMQPPPNQMPGQPAPTLAAETKTGQERFA
ncbi:hypothetical protein C8A00DRAFT_44719 [Chaetomidium leptoderma]|uniref:MARVEL domain-containing protein n=1 Tax=Chaetomidium leptoderma TaxID=669021 RepID=A0AAN6ZVU8_9PEZI|nr:hypothetical protein C8A00DRAFT_44719 [Chaetomidium leptoderma]